MFNTGCFTALGAAPVRDCSMASTDFSILFVPWMVFMRMIRSLSNAMALIPGSDGHTGPEMPKTLSWQEQLGRSSFAGTCSRRFL